MPEETVWTSRPSQILNLPVFILWAALSLTLVLLPIAAGVILWKYLVLRTQRYELTSERFKTYTGVLSRRIDQVELYRIKDITYVQPIGLRLFGLANLVLHSSDLSQPLQIIRGVRNAEAVRDVLRVLVEERREQKGVRVIERE